MGEYSYVFSATALSPATLLPFFYCGVSCCELFIDITAPFYRIFSCLSIITITLPLLRFVRLLIPIIIVFHAVLTYDQVEPSMTRIFERPLLASMSIECSHPGKNLRQTMKVKSV